MPSIAEDLKRKKEIAVTKTTVTMEVELKEKATYIAKEYGIKLSDYLATILKKSEIDKVFSKLKNKEEKASKSNEESNERGNE